MTAATCMCAPLSSRCRNEASRAVRRVSTHRSSQPRRGPATRDRGGRLRRGSRRQTAHIMLKTFNRLCKVGGARVVRLSSDPPQTLEPAMDLSNPVTFGRIYDEHRRSVHATAYRVLNNSAAAQDVVQDVFLRVWRNPQKFDARRGELGSYLRLMARSRAVDLWREGQASGRAEDRLKAVVSHDAPRPDAQP